jgi:uncharacterized membrane protein AbrB (regulator of aidB expression)
VHLLFVVNAIVLAAFGALYLLFASWPAGLIIGSTLIAAALVLFALSTRDVQRQRQRGR